MLNLRPFKNCLALNHSYSFPLVVHQVYSTLHTLHTTVECFPQPCVLFSSQDCFEHNWLISFTSFGLFISGLDILFKTTGLHMIV